MSKTPLPIPMALALTLGCSGLIVTVGCAELDSSRTASHATGRPPELSKQVETLGTPLEKELGYVEGVKVQDTIFVAGQLSLDDQGAVKGAKDMETQMRQAYANVEKILAHYGAKMKDIVEEVLYVTDMQSALAVGPRVRRNVYSEQPQVASTIVQVDRLAVPEALIEIKVTAKVEMPLSQSSPTPPGGGRRGGGGSRGMGGGFPRF